MSGANKFICPLQRVKNTFVNCDFFERQTKFFILGFLEQGKPFATALGLKACEQGYQVKLFRVADLVGLLDELYKLREFNPYQKKQIEACDF